MDARIIFENEDKKLKHLEEDTGFIIIDMAFEVAIHMQIEDMIKKVYDDSNSNDLIDVYLVVESRNFDLEENCLIILCLVLEDDDQDNNNALTIFQSLN